VIYYYHSLFIPFPYVNPSVITANMRLNIVIFHIYCIGFNVYWHRIAYSVLMVPLRIYSLTPLFPMLTC